MTPLIFIVPAVLVAARWLRSDAERRDNDPKSQTRSDWLQVCEDERNGVYEKIVNE